jgi:hypothetical protein
LKVCHDSSGQGNMASWFLKFIIVHDLQTREKYYFICDKWLAIEKEDCPIDILLPVCGNAQKNDLKYLFEKQSIDKLIDSHMWLSVFTRPVQSSFTRTDRLTCCFVLLNMSMLMNIMYYGMQSESPSQDGLKLGPINITPEQVYFKFF